MSHKPSAASYHVDHAPVKQAPRRIPFSLRTKVEEMVKEMLDHGIIEHSSSPWVSPIVLVSKHMDQSIFVWVIGVYHQTRRVSTPSH